VSRGADRLDGSTALKISCGFAARAETATSLATRAARGVDRRSGWSARISA